MVSWHIPIYLHKFEMKENYSRIARHTPLWNYQQCKNRLLYKTRPLWNGHCRSKYSEWEIIKTRNRSLPWTWRRGVRIGRIYYIIATLPVTYERGSVGLHRDKGLMVHMSTSVSRAERISKELTDYFAALGLKTTDQMNLKISNFLNLVLYLMFGKHYPIRKENNDTCYISRRWNHPTAVCANIPMAVSRRITDPETTERVRCRGSHVQRRT